MSPPALITLLCCAFAVSAVPPIAQGAERAKFRVTVTGADRASWSYRLVGSCGAGLVGTGSQTIRYATARTVAVVARSARGGSGFDPTARLPRLGPGPRDGVRFPVRATIMRQSTLTGCSDDSEPVTPADCGTKSFSVLGNLRFLRAGRLGFFTMAASLRHPFRNCPNFFGRTRDAVGVGMREAPGRLSARTLFNSSRRVFTVRGRGSYRSRGATFHSSWKAKFRRVR